LGTVVIERSFDMLCLLLWMALLLLFKWGEFGNFIQLEIIEPLFGKFSSVMWPLAIVVSFMAIVAATLWIFRRTILRIPLFDKIFRIAKGLLDGVLTAFKMQHKWMFLLYTLLIWLTYWLTSLTTIYAFPLAEHLGATDALFLMIIGGFGWVVPVQGGLGAYHFIVSLALSSVYGISQATGVVFATISHEAQALVMIICGAVSLVSVSIWKKKINQ